MDRRLIFDILTQDFNSDDRNRDGMSELVPFAVLVFLPCFLANWADGNSRNANVHALIFDCLLFAFHDLARFAAHQSPTVDNVSGMENFFRVRNSFEVQLRLDDDWIPEGELRFRFA